MPRGLTVGEVLVALGILVLALVAIFGIVDDAVRSVGVGEDLLDLQQSARLALGKFSDEARWATRLVDDAMFFGRTPVAPVPPGCVGTVCPESVNLEVPRSNPIIGGCAYYVRFARDGALNGLTRQVKPDPAQGPPYGTGACQATDPQALVTFVSSLVFEHCDAAGACFSKPAAPSPEHVVRIRGRITVSKVRGGTTQHRTVDGDALLGSAGAATSPGESVSPPSPPQSR
jgi:hypothetical protein